MIGNQSAAETTFTEKIEELCAGSGRDESLEVLPTLPSMHQGLLKEL